jgi:hypothetical protein
MVRLPLGLRLSAHPRVHPREGLDDGLGSPAPLPRAVVVASSRDAGAAHAKARQIDDSSKKRVIRLANSMHRWHRRFGVTLVLFSLAFLLAWSHNGPAVDHMDSGDVIAICLAVIEVAVLGWGNAAGARPGRPRRTHGPPPAGISCLLPALHTGPPARAGPAFLQVFRD